MPETKSEQRYTRVRQLIDSGMSPGEAILAVAQEEGGSENAVRTSYYHAAQKRGFGRGKTAQKNRKAQPRPAAALMDQISGPRKQPASTNGNLTEIRLGTDVTLKDLVNDLEQAQHQLAACQARLVAYGIERDNRLAELRNVIFK